MIHVQLRHPKRNTVEEGAKLMGGWLSHHLGNRLSGPFEPSVARLRTYYLQDMMIRVKPDGKELGRVKDMLRKAVDQLGKTERLTGVRVVTYIFEPEGSSGHSPSPLDYRFPS